MGWVFFEKKILVVSFFVTSCIVMSGIGCGFVVKGISSSIVIVVIFVLRSFYLRRYRTLARELFLWLNGGVIDASKHECKGHGHWTDEPKERALVRSAVLCHL
jgi:hypothetical protein